MSRTYDFIDNVLTIYGYYDWTVDPMDDLDEEGAPKFYRSRTKYWTIWKFRDIEICMPNTIRKNVINIVDKTYEEYGLPKIRRYGMDSMIYVYDGDEKIKFFPTVGVIYDGVVSANLELLKEGYLLNNKVFIEYNIVDVLKENGYSCIASFNGDLQIMDTLNIDFRNIRKLVELDISKVKKNINFIDALKEDKEVYDNKEGVNELIRIVLKNI